MKDEKWIKYRTRILLGAIAIGFLIGAISGRTILPVVRVHEVTNEITKEVTVEVLPTFFSECTSKVEALYTGLRKGTDIPLPRCNFGVQVRRGRAQYNDQEGKPIMLDTLFLQYEINIADFDRGCCHILILDDTTDLIFRFP